MQSQSNKFGLTSRDMDTIRDIFSKYVQVRSVYLFGSRAKGTYKPGSDIDLAVMNEGVPEKICRSLRSDFETSTLPYRVELVDFHTLRNPDFIDHISRVGIPFYERSEAGRYSLG